MINLEAKKLIDAKEFKVWLVENTNYSAAVVTDTVSRIKRADKILEWNEEDVYQFRLEQKDKYKMLSVSVRSQIKKAVKLYTEFWVSQEGKVE